MIRGVWFSSISTDRADSKRIIRTDTCKHCRILRICGGLLHHNDYPIFGWIRSLLRPPPPGRPGILLRTEPSLPFGLPDPRFPVIFLSGYVIDAVAALRDVPLDIAGTALPRASRQCRGFHCVTLGGSPLPWRLYLALPDANLCRFGGRLLRGECAFGISWPVHGVAIANQPSLNATAVSPGAVADETVVLIPADELACRWG